MKSAVKNQNSNFAKRLDLGTYKPTYTDVHVLNSWEDNSFIKDNFGVYGYMYTGTAGKYTYLKGQCRYFDQGVQR